MKLELRWVPNWGTGVIWQGTGSLSVAENHLESFENPNAHAVFTGRARHGHTDVPIGSDVQP